MKKDIDFTTIKFSYRAVNLVKELAQSGIDFFQEKSCIGPRHYPNSHIAGVIVFG